MDSENFPEISAEIKVDRFMDEVVFEKELSMSFHGYIIHTADDQLMTFKKHQENFRSLFTSFSEEELAPGLNHYVNMISTTRIQHKSRLLVSLLEYGVKNDYISPRLVCKTLLKSDSLVYEREDFWCLSFALIHTIIPRVDYKGVRELFAELLEKACDFETANNVCEMNQLRAIQKVLETILDRNTCLLPSYLILEEIQKKFAVKEFHSHWKFSKLISDFVDSFRLAAKMVSLSVLMVAKNEDAACGHSTLLPVIGYSSKLGNVWRLDPITGKAPLQGPLPYNKELLEPQASLLRYALKQPYSKDIICIMLGVSKQNKIRCLVLEEQLIELIVATMDESASDLDIKDDEIPIQLLWHHIASQLIYFVLFEYANFQEFINLLHAKLLGRHEKKGRHHVMWILLQFISGSLHTKNLNVFLPVLKLYDLLYPEKNPLPIPDVTKSSSVYAFASIGIWTHLMRKAQLDKVTFPRRFPIALTSHLEYLQNAIRAKDLKDSLNTDYRLSLLCNTYSNTKEHFSRNVGYLFEAIKGPKDQALLKGPIKPLSMSILDSLTVHTKMSMMNHIIHRVIELAESKSATGISPAFIETYSRLLAYSETESLGLKEFTSHLLPKVLQCHAWSILHTLLELYCYRLPYLPAFYRVKLLHQLHTITVVAQTNQIQLHICYESAALKLISGMANNDVQMQISKIIKDRKKIAFNDSEELNKALVLAIARAIRVTGFEILSGNWCSKILKDLMKSTPHSWSSFTTKCFPRVVGAFFESHQVPKHNRAQLKILVEQEYKKWKTMSNEKDKILHFSLQGGSPYFLCLMWKMILEQDGISSIAYEILDRIGSRALTAHLRAFADFLVFEFSNSAVGHHVNKYLDALNDLIWKCHAVQLDRLILCLALRSFEGSEAQVCFFIIHMILMKPEEFKKQVYDFVKDNSPEHWKQSNWHEKHMAFHRTYKEKFYFEGLRNTNTAKNSQHTYLPIYFGNICLRFLPVMDLIIHRFIEIPMVTSLEKLLEELGCLYKFHDRPLTYLYTTLHYYELILQDFPLLKKKLVSTIIGALESIRPERWALSEGYLSYIQNTSNELTWIPEYDYFVKLIGRLVDTLHGKSPFPDIDGRFNEFPNLAAHALHVTCIELLALPLSTQAVATALLNVIFKGNTVTVHSNIVEWMNAVGVVLISLPKTYLDVLYNLIIDTLQSFLVANPFEYMDPFVMFDFAGTYNSKVEIPCSYLIALTHTVWYHATMGQISTLPRILREKFKPAVKTETQFLYVCHLVVPLINRFYPEITRAMMEITVEIYEMLEVVDKNCDELQYVDAICDLLYHIKYTYIGDAVKIERSIKNLKPALQHKLQFIMTQNAV